MRERHPMERHPMDHDPVDEAAALLRRAQPVLSPEAPEALAEAARLAVRGRKRQGHGQRMLGLGLAAGAAFAALALGAVLVLDETPAEPTAGAAVEPVEVAVSGMPGLRVLTLPDTELRIDPAVGPRRALRMEAGTALFDVPPQPAGQVFEVHTPDAVVTVLGTIFTVEVTRRGTAVRVREGRVRVTGENERQELTPGETFAGNLSEGGLAALDRLALSMAADRAHVAVVEAPTPIAEAETHPEPVDTTTATPIAAARRAPRVTVGDARGWLREGDAERAAQVAARSCPGDADWCRVLAEAARSLGHLDDAAEAYDHAVRASTVAEAHRPAYLAARIWLRAGNPAAALASLDGGRVLHAPGTLRERGLALAGDAYAALGDPDGLRRTAAAYLEAFPEGPRAEWMRLRME